MDHLERPYRTKMRIRVDPELIADVQWYFAVEGAELFPVPHAFGSMVWESTDHEFPADGLGEVNAFGRVVTNKPPEDAAPGTGTVTPLEWFTEGVPAGIVGPFPLGRCPNAGERFGLCLSLCEAAMPQAIVVDDGPRVALLSVRDCLDRWQIMLWVNDLVPTVATRRNDLVEATFPGYVRQEPDWQAPVPATAGRVRTSSLPLTWRRSSGAGSQTAYGWAALHPDTQELITLQRFSAPQTVAAVGDPVVIAALDLDMCVCSGPPVLTPQTITLVGDTDNLTVLGGPINVMIAGNVSLTGVAPPAPGALLLIYNAGPGTLTLPLASAASAAANRWTVPAGWAGCTQVVLEPRESSSWWSDPSGEGWRLLGLNAVQKPSGAQHSPGLVPDAGAVVGSSKRLAETATWAVEAAGGGSTRLDWFGLIPGKTGNTALPGHDYAWSSYQVASYAMGQLQINEEVFVDVIYAMVLPLPAGGWLKHASIWVDSLPGGAGEAHLALYLPADPGNSAGRDLLPDRRLLDFGNQPILGDGTETRWTLDTAYWLPPGVYHPAITFDSDAGIRAISRAVGTNDIGGYGALGFADPSKTAPDVGWIYGDRYGSTDVRFSDGLPVAFPTNAAFLRRLNAVDTEAIPAVFFYFEDGIDTGDGGGGGPDVDAIGDVIGGGHAGDLLFMGPGGVLAQDDRLTFDPVTGIFKLQFGSAFFEVISDGSVRVQNVNNNFSFAISDVGANAGLIVTSPDYSTVPNPGASSRGNAILQPRGFDLCIDGLGLSAGYQPSFGVALASGRGGPLMGLRNSVGPSILVQAGAVGIGIDTPGASLEVRNIVAGAPTVLLAGDGAAQPALLAAGAVGSSFIARVGLDLGGGAGYAAAFTDGTRTVFICNGNAHVSYDAGITGDWAGGSAPTDVWDALDRVAAALAGLGAAP